MEREETGRRLRTPASEPRHLRDEIRRSRSRTRRDVGDSPHGSRARLRSRSPIRQETLRRSRSRTRRREESRDSERNRARNRSCSPDWEQRKSIRLLEKELQLERERSKLRLLEDEIREERSRMRPGSRMNQMGRAKARQVSTRTERERSGSTMHYEYSRQRREKTEGEPDRQRPRRSVSPVYTRKDMINMLNNLKDTDIQYSSQPLAETSNISHTNSNLNHKNILPNFDPSLKNQRVDVWIKKVNECATVYGWDEKTIIHFAMQKLQGLAKTWYESLNTILFSWSEWQDKLMNAFPCEQNYGQSLEDMLKRKSRYSEPIELYYYEKLALLNQCDIVGKRAVDCIIHGLSDRTLKSSALALRCTDPDQLLKFLMSHKDTQQHFDRVIYKNRNVTESKPNYTHTDDKVSNRTAVNPGLFCYNCRVRGHPYMKCPKPLVRCIRCKRFGHKTEDCRIKTDGATTTTDSINKTMCISTASSNTKFIKDVTVNGRELQAFVDFGSSVSLMGKSSLTTLGLKTDNTSMPLRGFGNEIVHSLGSLTANLVVDGVHANVIFQVVDDTLLDVPILIGQTFTEQPHIVVYKNAKELKFYDLGTEMPYSNSSLYDDETVRVSAAFNFQVNGSASIKITTEPRIDGNILISGKVVGKPTEQFMIHGGVYQVSNGLAHITVTPLASYFQIIMGATLCRASRIQIVNRIVCPISEEVAEAKEIDKDMVRIGEKATEQDKQKLFSILDKYKHCFAYTLKELGCTDVTEMTIEVNSKRPVVYRPYRLSHKEREQVRTMIDEMLEAGVIRESVSEYASPIILVRKKDGRWRMCIDYRLLNSITVKEHYPMPIIEDEIARLSGQAYFITLDLASGYYQVPISETSRALTSFVTPDGQYEFNRMPFGLANAPAVFQRMMNRVLGSSRYTEATAYIDDVLIYGKDKNECLTRLEKILRLLHEANLTLNLAKCEFLQDKIDYLGYEISASGVRPGDKKIQCVLDFPRPSNQHTVRQFLGLVGYFRKFVQNFAHIAHPLNKLLKKDAAWCWTEEQEEAFRLLKEKLTKRPILAIYHPAADTELHTDASKLGIGGILLQKANGDDTFRPVAFYSRQTTPEEKHFHAYELETLAVVCSLRKFRVYLLGQSFKIVTDCSALRSTFTKRDIIPRVARWWLLLQEFDCSVEYRSGSKMAHVDALSRNPLPEENINSLDQYPSVMSINSEDWLLTLQLGDTELCRIRDIISSDIDAEGLTHIKNNYLIKDNKLYKCVDGDKGNLRWVVPKGARWQICRLNHDEIGHFGVEKTLDRIKKAYWFPKMSRFIKKYVQACVQCAYSKKTNTPKEGHLHPSEKVEIPFHTIHIDHLGPFVRSKRGNSHLLIVVDAFTKFVFIKPVRNTNTHNVLLVLEDIFYTFRCPDRIISDRGSCFTSHAFKRFCLDKGIKHVLNAVASPRSNGQVERYNRSILDSLTAQNLDKDEREWDDRVGVIQWGMNNTTQKTTGRSPAEVMFGTHMNSEVNPKLNEIRRETTAGTDVTSIRREVKERIKENQDKQKEYYDKSRKTARVYSEGDLVKITKVTFNNKGQSTKLLPQYIGPYRVVSVLGNDRYKLAAIPGLTGSKNKRKTTVASDRMLPWVHIASLDIQNSDSNDDE